LGLSVGGNYNFSPFLNSSSNINLNFDHNSNLRWSLSHQQEQWQVRLQGNEVSFNSEVSYRLPTLPGTINHQLVGNYQVTTTGLSTTLAQGLWRYQTVNFQSELGYGISGFGSGINGAVGLTFVPGFQILGRYQGVSAFTNQANFSLEFQSTLDVQNGVRVANTGVEDLRTKGGIALQPFLDRNLNGRRDSNEEAYWHADLFTLNNQPLNSSQTTWFGDRAEVRSIPGSYRLDLNPTHFPKGWWTSIKALRINVASGSFTNISIPLIPNYSVTGIITDRAGKPLAEKEIVLTPIAGLGERISTTTDRVGHYEFKNLDPGIYRTKIDDTEHPVLITINPNSALNQKIDLKLPDLPVEIRQHQRRLLPPKKRNLPTKNPRRSDRQLLSPTRSVSISDLQNLD
jgi:hypothetical protein